MVKVKKGNQRINQGDIFRDVEFIEYATEKNGIVEFSRIIFPLVVVLTQDCDLEQNHHAMFSRKRSKNQDKWLLSVLVAPLYNAEHFYLGSHLSELKMTMQTINKTRKDGDLIRQNRDPRFHFLEFPEKIPIVSSVVDFKHYFSINVKYLQKIRKTNYICSISPLYREQISHRFAYFLSRIGLPN